MPLDGLWAFRSAPSDLWPWTQGEAQPLKQEPRGNVLDEDLIAFDNRKTFPMVLLLGTYRPTNVLKLQGVN